MALNYHQLPESLELKIKSERLWRDGSPYRCWDESAIRRDETRDQPNLLRPPYVRDTEKILHLPVYNRYADKTQVFSFYQNDDITRRALHVQLVSRIARSIGRVLGLNLDLIEAISLGHDLGHTPFGHAGERILDEICRDRAGRHFAHNVQSVRVLDRIFARNVSLQTLDGILCHNGEFILGRYEPQAMTDFSAFDQTLERCAVQGNMEIEKLVPSTLEGCLVRICDMIAYLGKDRQDARTACLIDDGEEFSPLETGSENAEIINNVSVDLIQNSYGKGYLELSAPVYRDLLTAKRENSLKIYANPHVDQKYEADIRPMLHQMYDRLVSDVREDKTDSPVFRHHISFVEQSVRHYGHVPYREETPDQIVTDYIASMTDDYFLELYRFLFPKSSHGVVFQSYFDDLKSSEEGDVH